MFVVLEGIDGSGTTTQVARAKAELEARGHSVHTTREPSTGPIGRLLRQVLEGSLRGDTGPVRMDFRSLALLFAADRADHLAREIEPKLASGQLVISDRYDLSSLIYQSETSPDPEAYLPWLTGLNDQARRPDLTIVLHVEAKVALERRLARGGAEELFEVPELQARLAARYAEAGKYRPLDRIVVVDASGSVAEVAAAVLAILLGQLEPQDSA